MFSRKAFVVLVTIQKNEFVKTKKKKNPTNLRIQRVNFILLLLTSLLPLFLSLLAYDAIKQNVTMRVSHNQLKFVTLLNQVTHVQAHSIGTIHQQFVSFFLLF